jgi:hypothetical protein
MPVAAALITGGIGLVQTIAGGAKQRKATKQLERLKAPTYKQNQSILDYYNQALSRYGVSPTDSAMYKRQMQSIGRNTATGISALQDRRSGQAGISSLMRYANDASLNAEVAAENERNNRFGVLGGATTLRAGEDEKAYQYNEYMPFERKANLYAAKAGGGTQIANAGLQNISNAANSYAQYQMLRQIYGTGGGGSRSSGYGGATRGDPANPPSDKRLKHNYFIIGKSPSGINIYEFSYIGSNKRYVGVMADEVPQASIEINGYLFVDYSKTDVEFKEL